jgi:hypothetical protein
VVLEFALPLVRLCQWLKSWYVPTQGSGIASETDLIPILFSLRWYSWIVRANIFVQKIEAPSREGIHSVCATWLFIVAN